MIRLFAALALLSSVLAAHTAEWVKINGRNAHPTHILVKYKPNADKAKSALVAQNVDLKRTFSEIPRLHVVELKDGALKASLGANYAPADGLAESIRQLKGTGLFEYVEPDYVNTIDLTPTDRRFRDGTLWGLQNQGIGGGLVGADINVVPAWDITTGDTNVIVAVIDTGINYTHKDLATQMWINPGEIPGNGLDDDLDGYVDNVYGINAVADTGDPKDDNGHGSHVSGTIGAAANNGFEHVGVIWNVRLMALKAFDKDGSGLTSDEIQCINFALSKRVRISNNR